MDRKKQEAIAIFRYGVIAPVLHGSSQSQADYFRQLAEKPLEVPFAEPRRFRPSTFKAWLLRYRKEGFEGLLPRSRSDCGVSRVISRELSQLIGQILSQHPTLAVVDLRERLIRLGQITSRRISESTLRRHIAHEGLRPSARSPIQARKRFEKPHANDLWTLDFMHGPRLPLEARRKAAKTYLLAAIDDHSRFLTSARFYAQENSATVAAALKEAFSRHGLPKILYCDNASAFSSRQLSLACARLGVALVHSRPYDAASRGKIERFFRSLRQRFLANLPTCASLAELNTRLQDWIDEDYHRRLHRGIGESPLDRYLRSLARVPPRRPSREELDHLFFRSFTRRAAPDATVSIDHVLWELPPAYSGQKVEIRHPEGKPQELYLFDQQQLVCRLQRVNLTENASRPRPLRFSLQEEPDP